MPFCYFESGLNLNFDNGEDYFIAGAWLDYLTSFFPSRPHPRRNRHYRRELGRKKGEPGSC